MAFVAAGILFLTSIIGIALTLITLPGTWFILGVAVLIHWLWLPYFNPWVLWTCAGLAVLGEVADIATSAVGSSRVGGGRSGAIGSIVGGIVGAVAGSIFIPIPVVGTILGGVLGAGLGALALERGISQKSWKQSAQIGGGAAAGKAVALIVKVALAAIMGVSLTIDAMIR